MKYQNFFFQEESESQVLPNGVIRKVLAYNDNLMIVENHFTESGQVGAMHQHIHEQITYVLSGVFKFKIGDQEKVVKQGDSMYKQPNIIHGCICLEPGVLLDIFTPKRADFLESK